MLDEALATLSEAQRQTFVLHADAGLSYREVADATGVSIGTVMSRLFYARQKLRAYLQPTDDPMRHDRTHPDPSPEQLAAFLDGELDAADRSRVEAWLADDRRRRRRDRRPAARTRLWGETPRPSQAPTSGRPLWLASKPACPPRCRRPRRRPRVLGVGAAAAAAAVAAVLLSRLFHGGPAMPIADKTDPLPVIEPGDVVIISMDARDAAGLVVGPAARPAADPPGQPGRRVVHGRWSRPRDDGLVPLIGEGEVPMIVAPLARAGGREP